MLSNNFVYFLLALDETVDMNHLQSTFFVCIHSQVEAISGEKIMYITLQLKYMYKKGKINIFLVVNVMDKTVYCVIISVQISTRKCLTFLTLLENQLLKICRLDL